MGSIKTITKPLAAVAAAFAVAFACLLGTASTAHADTVDLSWNVTFGADGKMTSDYSQKTLDDALKGLQPGDSFTLKVNLKNDSGQRTGWYMASSALKSLEEGSKAANGAYAYDLYYGDTAIYSSKTVGGDESTGFREIDGATGSWFWLGYIEAGSTGNARLVMTLDGETQDNAYMNTVGKLNITFACEFDEGVAVQETPQETSGGSTVGNLPKTGDPLTFTLYLLGGLIVGACLIISIVNLRRMRKGRDA